MSSRSAPSSTMRRAWATAAATGSSAASSPSPENESGVTLRTPITNVRLPQSSVAGRPAAGPGRRAARPTASSGSAYDGVAAPPPGVGALGDGAALGGAGRASVMPVVVDRIAQERVVDQPRPRLADEVQRARRRRSGRRRCRAPRRARPPAGRRRARGPSAPSEPPGPPRLRERLRRRAPAGASTAVRRTVAPSSAGDAATARTVAVDVLVGHRRPDHRQRAGPQERAEVVERLGERARPRPRCGRRRGARSRPRRRRSSSSRPGQRAVA